MNILETVGALTVGYLTVGAIVLIVASRASVDEDGLLLEALYTFMYVTSWPIVLLERFVPAVRRALPDSDGPDAGKTP